MPKQALTDGAKQDLIDEIQALVKEKNLPLDVKQTANLEANGCTTCTLCPCMICP